MDAERMFELLELIAVKVSTIETEMADARSDISELKKMDAKISRIESEMGEFRAEMAEVRTNMTEVRTEMAEFRSEMTEVRTDIAEIRTEMSEARSDISELKKMDAKIIDIQLTLENETNKNIQIIAEGHVDLSRKLDEALKVENEKELLLIRVNRMENELRKIKERMDTIA